MTSVNQDLARHVEELQQKNLDQSGELKEIKAQKENALSQIQQMKKELQAAQGDSGKLAFLARQLKGVKAEIITDLGSMMVEFYPDKAPLHCFNFIVRAESGYFNGTQFHRVIPGFMIQGGDPNSKDDDFSNDGMGEPLVSIPHEFNDLNHVRGILSMARVSDPSRGAGSQFFIMHADSPHLNHQYTVFGKVFDGLEVMDAIAQVDRDQRDHPRKAVRIKNIKVFR